MSAALRALAAGSVIAFLLFPLALSANDATDVHAGLMHELSTDEYFYWLPDTVQITYAVTNVTPDPIEIGWSWSCFPLQVRIYSPGDTLIWLEPSSCPPVVRVDTLEPGSRYEMSPIWDMTRLYGGQLIDEPGIYRVRGRLHTYYPELYHWVDLPIEVLDPSTAAPEWPRTWSIIKGLYR